MHSFEKYDCGGVELSVSLKIKMTLFTLNKFQEKGNIPSYKNSSVVILCSFYVYA